MHYCTACGTNSWSQPSESIKKKLLSTKMWVKCIKKLCKKKSNYEKKFLFWIASGLTVEKCWRYFWEDKVYVGILCLIVCGIFAFKIVETWL